MQKFLRTVLQRRGYRTVEATPSHALELVERGAESVGMVITNTPEVFLPFAEKVSLLYIAACPDLTLISPFRNCRALRKPFHPTELVEAVRELVRSL